MYVCICHKVTDTDIRKLVDERGVCSLEDLSEQLEVAMSCGRCQDCARDLLREFALHRTAQPASVGFSPA